REQAFAQQIRELSLEKSVVLAGPVPDQQLASLYRRATVFVFPSLYEGFGLPVLEAMAVGACVVARGASAMAEIVGDAGLCLEMRDPAQLAAGIAGLLHDSRRRLQLAAAARNRAAQFTINRMAHLTF